MFEFRDGVRDLAGKDLDLFTRLEAGGTSNLTVLLRGGTGGSWDGVDTWQWSGGGFDMLSQGARLQQCCTA